MMTATKKQRIRASIRTAIEAFLLIGGLILIACESEDVFSFEFIMTKLLGFTFWFILAKMTKNDPVE
ncbi:MAG: hypothetical protein PHS16_00230 [Candidatus Colwellbacteria bacterium]|jgi:hypothetical protein|nr:hypothetical protein [Candidatus Colwellbacteria bacterium]MCK9497226.1 hypothetical protein [Candidatus Colwellbacteria bacterium]MDD3752367.1 hypothetical protein [Candidatus Colwellbacteria bacterium]